MALPLDFGFAVDDSLVAAGHGLGGVAGVGYINGEFQISKWNTDALCTLNNNGKVTSKFRITGLSGTRSITTDGTSLFMRAAGAAIYAVNPVTKTLDSIITITGASTTARMCTYDPTANNGNGGFWIVNFTSDIVFVSGNEAVLQTVTQATHSVVSKKFVVK